MIDIFAVTKNALATLSPAVPFAMSPYEGTLPDLYVTYQLVQDDAEAHADNVEIARTYRVQVTIWDRNGLVNLPDIHTAMLAAGFRKGPRRPLPKDQQTGHFGLAQDFLYLDVSIQ